MKHGEWLRFSRTAVVDAKRRSKKNGLPFNLTKEWIRIKFRLDYSHCENCKIELKGKGKMAHNSPTLDRILPEKGYLQHNIQLLCNDCNLAKGNVSNSYELLDRIKKMSNMVKVLIEEER